MNTKKISQNKYELFHALKDYCTQVNWNYYKNNALLNLYKTAFTLFYNYQFYMDIIKYNKSKIFYY